MEFMERIKERMQTKRIRRLEMQTQDLFQVSEYDGQVWLKFGCTLICPMSFFKDDPMVVLALMRKYYMERCEKERL